MNLFSEPDMGQAYSNASQQYQDTYNQVADTLSPYTDPAAQDFGAYRKATYGGEASLMPARRQMVGELSGSPISDINTIESSYRMSPGAKFDLASDLRSEALGSSASGYYGTPGQKTQMARITQGIVSQDQQQYLQNVLRAAQMQARGYGSLQGNLQRMMDNILQKEYGATGRLVGAQETLGRELAGVDLGQGGYGEQERAGAVGLLGAVAPSVIGLF